MIDFFNRESITGDKAKERLEEFAGDVHLTILFSEVIAKKYRKMLDSQTSIEKEVDQGTLSNSVTTADLMKLQQQLVEPEQGVKLFSE